MTDTDALFEPFRRHPSTAGILTDFDGTLSPIAPRPDLARPAPGAVEVLDDLARRYPMVAVISGRPVAFLAANLPASIQLSGLYGLEARRDGRREVRSDAARWADVVEAAVARFVAAAPKGTLVEPKGLSLTVHYRNAPDAGPQVEAVARRLADETGLELRPAKMSVELHPPVEASKGTAVHELAAGLGAVTFLGDDVGDLTAFDALDELAAEGVHAVRVAVRTEEAPAEMLDRADVVLDGPDGAITLLRTLL